MEATTTSRQQLWFLNNLVTVHIGHDDGRDGIAVLESRAPYGESPPLHVHHTEDEMLYVLEGELRVRVGDTDVRVRAGEATLAPIAVPHTVRVDSPDGARWLNVTTHGDFEQFVRAVSRPAERSELPPRQGPPTADALAAVGREYGIEFVGPPLDS